MTTSITPYGRHNCKQYVRINMETEIHNLSRAIDIHYRNMDRVKEMTAIRYMHGLIIICFMERMRIQIFLSCSNTERKHCFLQDGKKKIFSCQLESPFCDSRICSVTPPSAINVKKHLLFKHLLPL